MERDYNLRRLGIHFPCKSSQRFHLSVQLKSHSLPQLHRVPPKACGTSSSRACGAVADIEPQIEDEVADIAAPAERVPIKLIGITG